MADDRAQDNVKTDFLIAIGVAIVSYALSHSFDLNEKWVAWSAEHEDWELDEVPIAIALAVGAFAWFSFRRWQAFHRQLRKARELHARLQDAAATQAVTSNELLQSEAKFRELVENLPVSITLKDIDGRFTLVNRVFEERFQKPASEMIGKTDYDLHSRQTADELARHDREILDTFRTSSHEFLVEFADGKAHTVIVTKFPFFNTLGNMSGFGSISLDITEHKQAEERLIQAQKMEAVGQLTGGVAHDFNNLLAVIQGNAELIVERQIESLNNLVAPILRSTRRGTELTQRLLAFSRRQPLRPKSINVAALVKGMSDLMVRTLRETIAIEIVAAPDLWDVLADPGQLENALLNLAINARDAMPEGGRLTIECNNTALDQDYVAETSDAVAGDYVCLAVSDTGTGMTDDIRSHVFEPFFTTKEVGQGSGLGLSMVYGFAKQSGGHVSIYSEQDRGTAVKLFLPRTEGVPVAEEAAPSAELPRGQGEMILVIEDDKDFRALAKKMLEGLGYRVIAVGMAAEARQVLAEREPVDLILSDVVLPGGKSGPEFAEEVSTTHPGLKVIFMSGFPTQAAKHNGLLGPDKALLNKPFQLQELAVTLREALD